MDVDKIGLCQTGFSQQIVYLFNEVKLCKCVFCAIARNDLISFFLYFTAFVFMRNIYYAVVHHFCKILLIRPRDWSIPD